MQYDFIIYPSLLDAYAWYKKSESAECKQELIDKINRVPFQSDAADKGTAFNELVDKLIETDTGFSPETEKICYNQFDFKANVLMKFVDELKGAVPQVRVEAEIETDNGLVLLYGYADEVIADTCIDIKTTQSYEFPKFLHNWQHVVYPYCLNQMGIECNHFTYLITDFNNVFKEDYKYEEKRVLNRLKAELNDFIFFLEINRHLITDKKVFGQVDLMIAEFDTDVNSIIVS